MSSILEGIKTGLSIVVGVGVTYITNGAVNMVTANEKNPAIKACIAVASSVVGGMVADASKDYISKEVDELARLYDGVKTALSNKELEGGEPQ